MIVGSIDPKDHVRQGAANESKEIVSDSVRPETLPNLSDPNMIAPVPVVPGLSSNPDFWLPACPLRPVRPPLVPDTETGPAVTAGIRDTLTRAKPDPERVKPRQNLAETDPAAFVLLLTSRLEKVKESRGKMEKLLSWVNQVRV
ncbi:unnamed protein product [Echinostoma caproni]|uniref:BESS domain-containing protein n=1 Tax=Echinostoma caproni TaxID=27848 RepID=A0A183BH11_9TREM|nr:unnamed protein product [Echinostoma caproni]